MDRFEKYYERVRPFLKPSTALVSAALLLAACGVEDAGTGTSSLPTTTTTIAATTTTVPATTTTVADYYDGFTANVLPTDTTLVAKARGEMEVFAEPDAPEPETTLPETTILGTVTVATIVSGPIDGWAEVMLPIRPNGSTGWVKIDAVDLFVVEGRLVVDLSEKTLTYYRNGEELLSSPVAIGTPRNPTPTGHFYVTDNVTLANPGSPWGPHALGLSGRSDTITEYNGGDGIIGIHGTNRPGSIGNAASLGCVRLPNDVITSIHELVAIGTPVEIRA